MFLFLFFVSHLPDSWQSPCFGKICFLKPSLSWSDCIRAASWVPVDALAQSGRVPVIFPCLCATSRFLMVAADSAKTTYVMLRESAHWFYLVQIAHVSADALRFSHYMWANWNKSNRAWSMIRGLQSREIWRKIRISMLGRNRWLDEVIDFGMI